MPSYILFLLYFVVSPFFFHLVSPQLTGSITSPGNAFIVKVSIRNPTFDSISILKWNNIFDDDTQLPVAFSIKDNRGTDLQIASSYAMRSGMTNSDLYILEPQTTFTHHFDLRNYIKNLPGHTRGKHPRVIQLSLPSAFQGIAHREPYTVPAEAAADLSVSPPRLGNFSAAGLKSITLTSTPLQLSFDFPIFQQPHPTIAAGASSLNGIHPSPRQCVNEAAQTLRDALTDTALYARSLKLAASNDANNSTLYRSYFSAASRDAVQFIANAIGNSIAGHGPHVDLYCSDILSLCSTPNPKSKSNILGYTFTPSWIGDAYVVLCPQALELGRAPAPCDGDGDEGDAGASTARVLFDLMLTLNNVVRRVISVSVYGALGSQQLLNASRAGVGRGGVGLDPMRNVDSFAQLAVDQWRYGLGGPPYTGASCLPVEDGFAQSGKRTVSSRRLTRAERGMP